MFCFKSVQTRFKKQQFNLLCVGNYVLRFFKDFLPKNAMLSESAQKIQIAHKKKLLYFLLESGFSKILSIF